MYNVGDFIMYGRTDPRIKGSLLYEFFDKYRINDIVDDVTDPYITGYGCLVEVDSRFIPNNKGWNLGSEHSLILDLQVE